MDSEIRFTILKTGVSSTEENQCPDTKDLLPCRFPSQQGSSYNLYSVILNIALVVLSEKEARVKALKDQLAYVRKVLNATRSKRLLEEATSGSKLSKRKIKGMKKSEQSCVGLPALPSISGHTEGSDDISFETASSVKQGSPIDETTVLSSKDTKISDSRNGSQEDASLPAYESSIPASYSDGRDVPSLKKADEAAPSAEQDGNRPEVMDSFPPGEFTVRCNEKDSSSEENNLLTAEGELTLDKRYLQDSVTAEFLADEESRIQKELATFNQKVGVEPEF